jgi:LuxR family maltose regulon positive regulatory protein
LSLKHLQPCWLSLDEDDNDPRLFWTYILSALDQQQPERFTPLLMELQTQSVPSNHLLTALINLLAESTEHFVLILDDYQVITQEQVHTTLLYLLAHLPPQLCIVLSTRADPPLSLSMLRAYQHLQEIRTEQLCCTAEETKTFFDEAMHIHLPNETVQEVTARTEGWLVGMQLLGLSLPGYADPATLLEEISGDQRYILDYLTEEVLRRQPQEVQTFLLYTSILGQLSASLCDAVMEQTGSQQMLHRLERSNLFVVSLDNKREWYRYHALFAEALRYRLEQTQGDLMLAFHHRASLWYAKHDQATQAILHALRAKEWLWAADLIERKRLPLVAHTWGASHHALALLQHWISQLPTEVMHARPLLCNTSAMLLLVTAPFSMLDSWLDVVEATLTALPTTQMQQEQADLLGAAICTRASLRGVEGDGWTTLTLCKQALSLASADNLRLRSQTLLIQALAYYVASVNDAKAGMQIALQAVSLAQEAGPPALTLNVMGSAAVFMTVAGQLHEAQQLTQQAMLLGQQPGGLISPEMGYPSSLRADILREWNKLDAALSLVEEAITLCKQTTSLSSLIYVLYGYSVLLRVYLSRGELDAACSALQQFEASGMSMNQPFYSLTHAHFTIVDQVRLWVACGELDRAIRWAKNLDLKGLHSNPFVREREEAALVRVLLARHQPNLALERLERVLQKATTGQRWRHVIEMRLLQALAHQMCQKEMQALDALSEALRLAEPEGYIRSFVDEGAPMESLLYRLRRQNRKHGLTPYLDTLLAAFQPESKAQAEEPAQAYQLPEPLSKREQEVLQLLADGVSNQEIAQELVIAIDTVKRHVSHIYSKLGVHNRVQAVQQARALGLFDESPDIREV